MSGDEPIENLSASLRGLLRVARQARKKAYAPYSKFLVGCVAVDAKGKKHSGCNVENASLGAAICAERTALVKMVSRGSRECVLLMLVSSADEPVFPCGQCLQVLSELAPEAVIYAVNRRATKYRQATLPELFPERFKRSHLRRG